METSYLDGRRCLAAFKAHSAVNCGDEEGKDGSFGGYLRKGHPCFRSASGGQCQWAGPKSGCHGLIGGWSLGRQTLITGGGSTPKTEMVGCD